MKYSDIKDTITKKVQKYSKQIDEVIDSNSNAKEIALAKNIKNMKLRDYQIKCLYDVAEYNDKLPKIRVGDDNFFVSIVDIANIINCILFKDYIKADTLYCGSGVSSY